MAGASEPLVSKRLHVAGLTTSITSKDLHERFSTFGQVTAVDGIGLLDGNGDPRKFGYVTVESTLPKVVRCMNLLSGSVWKGAKLRVGEAKPDWREREFASSPSKRRNAETDDRPTKKRKLASGTVGREAKDMAPVSLDNVATRKGWKVTALNHIYKPVRMRPPHPLPQPEFPSTSSRPSKVNGKPAKKQRAREQPPVNRARRMVLDPTRWGAVHLTGELLEATAGMVAARRESLDTGTEGAKPPFEQGPAIDGQHKTPPTRQKADPPTSLPSTERKPLAKQAAPAGKPDVKDDLTATFEAEKEAGLNVLRNLLGDDYEGTVPMSDDGEGGDSDDEAWPVVEDMREEAQEEELREAEKDRVGKEDGEEAEEETQVEEKEEEEEATDESGENSDKERAALDPSAQHKDTGAPVEMPVDEAPQLRSPRRETLKDLFAPREETGGFALDLDLDDLDEDPSLLPTSLPEPEPIFSHSLQSGPAQGPVAADLASLPLFFPTFDEQGNPVENTSGVTGRRRGQPKTFWDVAREKGWTDPDTWKAETEEEARAQWEKVKGDLTRDWKLRWREARKRRKRGGFDGEGAL